MDSLGRRAQLMAVLDRAMDRAQKTQRDVESGQHGLFGVFQQEDTEAHNDKLLTFLIGTSKRAWHRKKKFWDFLSAAIPWKNIKTSCRTCRRSALSRSAR